ncbi:MAG: hypothetical protein L6Q31_06005 [Fimbriimonadaceae bacterium]|nr:hypothetical protein [Fimbriimonadaceae bacterium]
MHLIKEVSVNPENEYSQHSAGEIERLLAEAGPGYRGRRVSLSDPRRKALAEAARSAGIAAPQYLEQATRWIDRPAKLFEAGSYPDKGVEITDEHLKALAERFDLPVPVLIEHSNSPLHMGYLTQVEARGSELHGTVSLTEEANRLIESSGARSLSLGLASDLSEIREVSIVSNPRVASAQLFSGSIEFSGALIGGDERGDDPVWRSKFEALERSMRLAGAEQQVQQFVREGKLTPAQVEFACALLECEQTLDFGEEKRPVRTLLLALIERQPPLKLFGELAPEGEPSGRAPELGPDEAAFYRRYFPTLDLDEIAARRNRQ